jgi:hypothetical protein
MRLDSGECCIATLRAPEVRLYGLDPEWSRSLILAQLATLPNAIFPRDATLESRSTRKPFRFVERAIMALAPACSGGWASA